MLHILITFRVLQGQEAWQVIALRLQLHLLQMMDDCASHPQNGAAALERISSCLTRQEAHSHCSHLLATNSSALKL